MRDPLTFLRDARLARLLTRSQRGDREAFRQLYRALYGPVSQFVRRRTASAADAEDVVAQVFLQLVASLAQLDSSRGRVLGFALCAARNLLIDRARARAVAEQGAPVPELRAPTQQDAVERDEELAALRARVAELPEDAQELLRLRFVEELGYAEISQVLGTSEATVRQRVSRAVRQLRKTWQDEAPGGAIAEDVDGRRARRSDAR